VFIIAVNFRERCLRFAVGDRAARPCLLGLSAAFGRGLKRLRYQPGGDCSAGSLLCLSTVSGRRALGPPSA